MDSQESEELTNKSKCTSKTERVKTRPVSFKSYATHVMIANSLAKNCKRKQPRQSPNNTASTCSSVRIDSQVPNVTSPRRPSSAESFPMSEEMKKALVSLGKIHLLTEEDQLREEVEDELIGFEKAEVESSNKFALSRFREKTRTRVMHPQTFIRNVRTSLDRLANQRKERQTVKGLKDNVLNSRPASMSHHASSGHGTRGVEVKTETRNTSRGAVTKQAIQVRTTKIKDKSGNFRVENAHQYHLRSTKRLKVSSVVHKQLQSFDPKAKRKTACDGSFSNNASAFQLKKLHPDALIDEKPLNKEKNRGSVAKFTKKTEKPGLPKTGAWTAEFNGNHTVKKDETYDFTKRRAYSAKFNTSQSAEINIRWKSVDELAADIQNKCNKWFEAREGLGESRFIEASMDQA